MKTSLYTVKIIVAAIWLRGMVVNSQILDHHNVRANKMEKPANYPSNYLETTKGGSGLSFVLLPVVDLRSLFCNEDTLNARISAKVCAVDFSFRAMGESREIPVGMGLSVKGVLDKIGKAHWKGPTPQIRIITRNSIRQSPIGKIPVDKKGIRLFLKERIEPGDIIIYGHRD